MKATIDIPDVLYHQVKVKSAMEGRRIRLVAIDLFSAWVGAGHEGDVKKDDKASHVGEPLPSWFGIAKPYASKVKRHDMDAVRESITRTRGGA